MSKQKLTKVEALKLIVPVVDGEATAKEQNAFFDFIEDYPEVRNKYKSIKNTKELVSSRCPYEQAPQSLKKFTRDLCRQASEKQKANISTSQTEDHEAESPTEYRVLFDLNIKKFVYGAVAAIFILIAGWQLFSYLNLTQQPTYNVEQAVYQHFSKHNGNFVPPTVNTASLGNAEMALASDYDINMTVPSLKNASFDGVVYDEFVPGFEAPMLEYHLPDTDKYIYIFAFKVDQLETFKQLFRNKEAINTCNKPTDFHIQIVENKHIVSWKWDDVWYAAISNHHGNTLASLVEPLQFSSK